MMSLLQWSHWCFPWDSESSMVRDTTADAFQPHNRWWWRRFCLVRHSQYNLCLWLPYRTVENQVIPWSHSDLVEILWKCNECSYKPDILQNFAYQCPSRTTHGKKVSTKGFATVLIAIVLLLAKYRYSLSRIYALRYCREACRCKGATSPANSVISFEPTGNFAEKSIILGSLLSGEANSRPKWSCFGAWRLWILSSLPQG